MTLTPDQRRDRLEMLQAAIAVAQRKRELGTPKRGDQHKQSCFGKRHVRWR